MRDCKGSCKTNGTRAKVKGLGVECPKMYYIVIVPPCIFMLSVSVLCDVLWSSLWSGQKVVYCRVNEESNEETCDRVFLS